MGITIDASKIIKASTTTGNDVVFDAVVLEKKANPGTAVDGQLNYSTDGKLYIYVTNAWVLVGGQTA